MPPSSERQLGNEPASAHVAQTLDLALAADWISPSVARDQVRAWLRANRWSPAHVDDLVLAVNEAVSNSIEHGYGLCAEEPGPAGRLIEVHGMITTAPDGSRRAELAVRDEGGWVPPSNAPHSTRGQGIRLMRACVEDLSIDGDDDGTTVIMHSYPALPPPLRLA